ncbi:MAG TPA: hypothetical protein VKW08_03995 [Xanthobacteraceae bacterium]|nr:hypothetical protein [Xanthobacteraceae bacterium]
MDCRSLMLAVALAVFSPASTDAQIFDYSKYPDLRGQWVRYGPSGPNLDGPLVRLGPSGVFRTRFDPHKPPGAAQEPPFTPEYQALFEANLKDQAEGGQGSAQTFTCISPGMPRATNGYGEIEFVVTPFTTYILVQHIDDDRRIYTDGRDWPTDIDPTFLGYTIGRWIDTQGSGHFDLLEAETRGPFRGPRAFDVTGAPLHKDNHTIVKERFYLDQANADILHDDVTVIDHALTRPWTVNKTYGREPNKERPFWRDNNCSETNNHVRIGSENYMLSADGFLMPTKKGQGAPDLRYFQQTQK